MPNRSLFKKFGHYCDIQKKNRVFSKHNKQKQYISKIKWNIRNLFLINETNSRGYNFLRSQKKMENEYKKQLLHPFTIHPFSDFRKYWELFMSIVILLQIYGASLHLIVCNMKVKDSFLESDLFHNGRIIVDGISAFDVLISFCSGYCIEKNSVIIVDLKRIISHYLKSDFIIDVCCSIPTDIIISFIDDVMLKGTKLHPKIIFALHFLCLFRLCRFVTVIKYMNHFFEVSDGSYLFYRIFMVLISFFTYIHVLSCVCIAWKSWEIPWGEEIQDSMMILKSYGPDVHNLLIMYVHFFYSTNLMILSAGYRLATFSNPSIIFAVNVWVLSKIIFILILAYFIEFYTVHQSSRQKYIDMVDEIKDCMKHKHIPDFLRFRILTYYDIKYQNYYFEESEILQTVSGQLRQEIVMNTCRKLVESVVFFKNLPLGLLIRIVSCLRYEIFLSNDIIAKAGTPGDSMYFIANGTVAVYTKSGKEICHLQDGDHFGEVALVTKEANRIASVVAVEACELYRLEKRDFIRSILPYPDLLDKIINVAGERAEKTDVMNEENRNVTSINVIQPNHAEYGKLNKNAVNL